MGNSCNTQHTTSIDESKEIMIHPKDLQNKFEEIEDHLKIPTLNQKVSDLLASKKPFFEQLQKIGKPKKKDLGGNLFIGEVHSLRKPNGFGKMYYKDGSVFVGEFSHGKPKGQGFFVKSDGTYYEGVIINQMLNCPVGTFHGKQFSYIGGFKDNLFHGQGKIVKDNYKLEGVFNEGKITQGVLEWKENQNQVYKYQGHFDEKMNMEGKGVLHEPNGKYKGHFKDNKKHGKGAYYYENGTRYVGNYVDGIKQGLGELYTRFDELIYSGEFKGDSPASGDSVKMLSTITLYRKLSNTSLANTKSTSSNTTLKSSLKSISHQADPKK